MTTTSQPEVLSGLGVKALGKSTAYKTVSTDESYALHVCMYVMAPTSVLEANAVLRTTTASPQQL